MRDVVLSKAQAAAQTARTATAAAAATAALLQLHSPCPFQLWRRRIEGQLAPASQQAQQRRATRAGAAAQAALPSWRLCSLVPGRSPRLRREAAWAHDSRSNTLIATTRATTPSSRRAGGRRRGGCFGRRRRRRRRRRGSSGAAKQWVAGCKWCCSKYATDGYNRRAARSRSLSPALARSHPLSPALARSRSSVGDVRAFMARAGVRLVRRVHERRALRVFFRLRSQPARGGRLPGMHNLAWRAP